MMNSPLLLQTEFVNTVVKTLLITILWCEPGPNLHGSVFGACPCITLNTGLVGGGRVEATVLGGAA